MLYYYQRGRGGAPSILTDRPAGSWIVGAGNFIEAGKELELPAGQASWKCQVFEKLEMLGVE